MNWNEEKEPSLNGNKGPVIIYRLGGGGGGGGGGWSPLIIIGNFCDPPPHVFAPIFTFRRVYLVF